MNSHKKKFYLLPAAVATARVDKLAWRQSTQRSQRQHSRFLGMVKSIFCDEKNLQQIFLRMRSSFTACCSQWNYVQT